MSDAVLAIAAELVGRAVLQRLVDAARELAGARYAALGVPDGEGGFERFITSGMSDELIAAMGPLPRTHGLLGAMLESPEPVPHDRHPPRPALPRLVAARRTRTMRSFLGVPIVARGGIIGAFYLTDKVGAAEFGDDDQRLIEMLAAHAAVAIENARLYERSRELSHRRGAQPARARAARLGHAEAVRRRAHRRGGGDAARPRPRRRRRRSSRACRSSRARRWRSCAR